MDLTLFIYGENGFLNSTLAASLSNSGYKVIGESDNYEAAIIQINRLAPDVAILNLEHNQTRAIDLSKNIRKRFPKMGIVFSSKAKDFRLLGLKKDDLPSGSVAAHICKHGDFDSLKEKINLAPYSTDCKSEFPINRDFTDSQIETLRLLAEGHANSEIAKVRFVSEKSVEQMLARIANMFGVTFDYQHNSRVRILNSYYELVNGR